MTFLNALLAFGAFAFTVPLAIHLLFRSRFTTLDWGAMHLLSSVVRINRRRIQLMNLLLLLLRCLLPILLAFCLARPVVTGFKSLPGDAPQSLVIAVDDSRSMSARDETGMTRMERVKQDLGEIVSKLSRRDEVILVPSSQSEAPAASMGAQDALRKIRELKTDSGPLDLGLLVRAAVEASREAAHPQRRILVASDFPSGNVSDATIDTLGRVASTLNQQPQRPVIHFLNYGVGSDRLSNVSVDSITIDSPAVVAGRGARFSARIRNASDRTAQDLRLAWAVDGKPLAPRTISIPPRSAATSRLTHTIETAGVHEVSLAVEHADALSADNRRTIGVDVVKEINVLLVDGKPSSRPLEGETDFLAIALSPFAFGGEDLPDAVRTTVVTMRQIAKEFQQQPDILVLANVKAVGEHSEAVAQFVLGGGSLVIFDGDAIDVDAYNDGWSCEDGQLVLPARLGEFVGSDDPKNAQPIAIGELNPQYTPWNLLQSKDRQPLTEVEVYGYRKLIPVEVESTDEAPPLQPAITLLSMSGGDPLVVSARRGRGQVVQVAVPCDAAWTTLPMRMVYLPMVQQLMLDLAGNRKRTTIPVGEGVMVPVGEFQGVAEEEQKTKSPPPFFTVERPGSGEESIEPTSDRLPLLRIGEALVPGTYRFRRTQKNKDASSVVASTIRVVEVPSDESRLRDTQPARLSAVAQTIDAKIYGDVQSLQSDDRQRRFGREIWRTLLIALLIGMIGELFLQQYTFRRSIRSEAI